MYKIGKSVFNLDHRKLLSMDYGNLVPCMLLEVVPNDTVESSTQMVVRQSPLVSPTHGDIKINLEFWYVPNRIVWNNPASAGDNWEEFITGGEDGANSATFPTIASADNANWRIGSLADYFGLPVPDGATYIAQTVSALPFRAYQKIYDTWYRNHNVQTTSPTIDYTGGSDTTTDLSLQVRNWEHSYFSQALPWTQKGTEATLSLGTTAPVESDGSKVYFSDYSDSWSNKALAKTASDDKAYFNGSGSGVAVDVKFGSTGTGLQTDLSSATAGSVNDLRLSLVTQRFAEKMARITRALYKNFVKMFFNIDSSDGRLHIPEYLGGGTSKMFVSEVLQSSATDTNTSSQTVQGNLAGHGITGTVGHKFRRTFEEHGYIIGLISVMPEEIYCSQGIDRHWLRDSKFEWLIPEFAGLGMQSIENRELYAAHSSPTGIFGYTERYNEYRHMDNKVHGQFRNTLDNWTQARKFGSDPSLNSAFLTADDSTNMNIHAITNEDPLYVEVGHKVTALRVLPKYATPSIMPMSA